MDTAQDIFSVANVTLYQRNMVFSVQTADKAVRLEVSILCRHIYHRSLIYQLFVALAVFLQVTDGNELDLKPFGQFCKLGGAHHRSIVTHDLAA